MGFLPHAECWQKCGEIGKHNFLYFRSALAIANSRLIVINGGILGANNLTGTWTSSVKLNGVGTTNRFGSLTGTALIGSNTGQTNSANPSMFTGAITLNRATTFQSNNPDRTTYIGAIGGTPGTVTINGTTAGTNTGNLNRTSWENKNTFTGNAVIAANSTLQVGTGAFAAPLDQIPDTADVTLNATSFLTLNGDSETINTLNSTATNSQIQSAAGGGQALRVLNGGTFNGIFNGGNNTGMTIEVAGGTMTFGGTVDNGTGRLLVTGGTAVREAQTFTPAQSRSAMAARPARSVGTLRW